MLALSLGAGVATALVLPAFGHDGNVDAGAAAIERDTGPSDDDDDRRTIDRVKHTRPDDADCVTDIGVAACDRPAGERRVGRRLDRRTGKRRIAVEP